MELAVGAMGTLAPKLLKLLQDEVVAQMGLKREIESLCRELPMMDAALVDVSKVPPEQLSETDKLWAEHARELSYDMEDAVDAFMVRVDRREPANAANTNIFKKIARKTKDAMKKVKDSHQISDKIKDIKDLSKELAELRAKYTFSGAAHAKTSDVDPRVINLYQSKGRELVGIEKGKEELLWMLTHPEDDKSLKIVSIVGSGGLGKTTLAQVVHDYLTAQPFDCCAFISVGQNPNITNILREMLDKLGKTCCSDMTSWSLERLYEELHQFLQGKRYNIVVDDVWEEKVWKAISCGLPDSNCGSNVIMTSRNSEISTKINVVYKMKPLPHDKSKELFSKRTSSKNEDSQLVDKIIAKCDGIPLAIIAIASLLADRPMEEWQVVYDSIVSGSEEENTRKILLYSYYDLPANLRPCLLYLSMYPEDSLIEKSTLIWRWIGEGFVQPQKDGRSSLFEVGERYFNDLLNRSMIQPAENGRVGIIDGCRVHDIVLDLIRDLSESENFVTMVYGEQFHSSRSVIRKKQVGLHGLERKVRRLFIQCSSKQSIPDGTIGMAEVVRSLHIINCSIDVPPLSSFQACRVLVAEHSRIGDVQHLGKLLHLRYLELEMRTFGKMHIEIGDLKSLQTLVVHDDQIKELPLTVFELTQLICLHVICPYLNFPADRMGNLVCLEELKLLVEVSVDDFVAVLGKLTRLRKLDIIFHCSLNETSSEAMMQSLNNLQEIRELKLTTRFSYDKVVSTWKSWKPPRQLWSLETNMGLYPQYIDPSRFQRVRYLCLSASQITAVDMRKLALLPELMYLTLDVDGSGRRVIIAAHGFGNLRVCAAKSTKFFFLQGAMPRLESLRFEARPGDDLDFNLAALLSLRDVTLEVHCYDYFRGHVEEAEAVVRRAVEDHPNRPTLHIIRLSEHKMVPDEKIKVQ
ncbi:hypothetical protein HU200_013329 [Digitaria exilis]|uniref:Uncharacterized protein n=1 Tax=Digitaria exilis TaxID=1010633 RepID=A0A835FDF2_9POAL|nr:hypothetical protein HU200_013329 [Digitaria exilis]